MKRFILIACITYCVVVSPYVYADATAGQGVNDETELSSLLTVLERQTNAYRVSGTFAQLLVRDLEALYSYIFAHDSHEKADDLIDNIGQTFSKLSELPHRGIYPKKLSAIGIREYREIFYKPYRIIYRVIRKAVYVYLITDSRRDMQTLLNQRLLLQ